jgi:cysteine sulfinate desulfinase/cysteine desulfurase-like protein
MRAHATLMADFILSARTINFDGRRLTMYTLATTGHKIAGNPGENKRGTGALFLSPGPSYQEIRS